MKVKILFLDRPACGEDLDYGVLSEMGEVFDLGTVQKEEQLLKIAANPLYRDAEILLCNKAPVTAEVQRALPNLRYIGVFATGYNNVDMREANRRDLAVCNVPGYSTEAVAQLVFAMILQIASNLRAYTEDTEQGAWVRYPLFSMITHPMEELQGKTLGILGYGNIGKRVADIGAAFGMNVQICTRTKKENCPYPYVDRETLLKSSDYLSLNAPLNSDTASFINKESISKMKDGAVLINTARGGLVDEEALAKALTDGKLRAAGLDVLREEPMSPHCPLLGLKNCFITPHIAWTPKETRIRLLKIAADNLRSFLAGTPQNRVH